MSDPQSVHITGNGMSEGIQSKWEFTIDREQPIHDTCQ